jgi:hypothetical protein
MGFSGNVHCVCVPNLVLQCLNLNPYYVYEELAIDQNLNVADTHLNNLKSNILGRINYAIRKKIFIKLNNKRLQMLTMQIKVITIRNVTKTAKRG